LFVKVITFTFGEVTNLKDIRSEMIIFGCH